MTPTYQIEFTVQGATLADVESAAAAALTMFTSRDAAEFKVTYSCTPLAQTVAGEVAVWEAVVTAIRSPGVGRPDK
jgi:hypothetical protein